MTVRYAHVPSDLGDLLVTDHGDGLSGVYFPGHRPGRVPEVAGDWVRDDDRFADVRDQLTAYLAGERTTFDLVLAARGSDLQRAVWDELATIPYGTTVTYGEVAAAIGRPSAARAVAGAVGRNPISIVVPCHRVVGANGTLTGYGGGLDRKRHLLRLEAVTLPV